MDEITLKEFIEEKRILKTKVKLMHIKLLDEEIKKLHQEGLTLSKLSLEDLILTPEFQLICTLKDKIITLVQASSNQGIKALLDYSRDLVNKSIWSIGGDGWAYDIGYGGLDHVLACNENINVLVLDTEVYSNTGGQASKSTQTGAIAKFAAAGKKTAKKDLASIAMAYGHVYVAQISMGANINQTIKALKEAESYNGPSLIIAYSPCIEHGIKGGLINHQKSQRDATECGYWPIFRFDPRLEAQGKNPLQIDCKEPNFDKYFDYILSQTRYNQLPKVNPENAQALLDANKTYSMRRWNKLKKMAG